MKLTAELAAWQQRSHVTLEGLLSPERVAVSRLRQAMAYSVLGGGKRLRPLLVYAACHAGGGAPEQADAPAAAVELVHAYSLIHDDLPAMDDDDLRRGRPSCHRAFDEATAILAGDALQALAFEVLAEASAPGAGERVAMLATLGRALGGRGMVAGQMEDVAVEGATPALDVLERIHRRKTGALIQACLRLGVLASAADSANLEAALERLGQALGLGFQIQDDILDEVASTEVLGKSQGADRARGKATYPALLGLEGARARLAELNEEALAALEMLGPDADPLRALVRLMIQRRY